MTMERYKICPSCGEHNPPNLMECRKCETDLTGIKVMNSTLEQKEAEEKNGGEESKNEENQPVLVRICECGAHNPPQARKCMVCGEDISDIMPVVEKQEKQKFCYELKSSVDDFSVTIDKPVCIIGREAELKEYLGSRMYVSRRHAKLTIVAGKVLIENLSNTNRTFINNSLMPEKDPVPLKDGDEIGLGGMEINGKRQDNAAYLVFRVKL